MLVAAASEIANGLVDARIGESLYKKRVAAPGRGKSRSYRILVAWKRGDKLFFLHGFAKNEKDNISQKEKAALSRLAEVYMSYDDDMLDELVADGDLLEIVSDEQDS